MEGGKIENTKEMKRVLWTVFVEIMEGLRHGYFELSVECEICKEKKRKLQLNAGKKFIFYIPESEVFDGTDLCD